MLCTVLWYSYETTLMKQLQLYVANLVADLKKIKLEKSIQARSLWPCKEPGRVAWSDGKRHP